MVMGILLHPDFLHSVLASIVGSLFILILTQVEKEILLKNKLNEV